MSAAFYRTGQGTQPVRDFLLGLPRDDRRIIGTHIATVEFGWPVGKPTCAPLRDGAVGSPQHFDDEPHSAGDIHAHEGQMVLLHGFIKKTQKTPQSDLNLARKRMKEVKR